MSVLKPESINRIIQAFSKTDYDVDFFWEEATEMEGTQRLLPVKCNLCNHIEKYHVSNLHKARYSCANCRLIRIKRKAEELNFEYLGKVRNTENQSVHNKIRLVLKCKIDQSITTAQTFHLLEGSTRCIECAINRYKAALALKDCEYISHKHNGKGKGTRVTFKNKFGENKTVASGSLLANIWAVSDILSSWVQKFYCYCFWFYLDNDDKLPSGLYYKIGISRNPYERLKKLKLTFNANVEILGEFSDRFSANENEKLLHRNNDEHKLDPEIVKTFTNGLASRKSKGGERFKVKDGITEWFYNKEGK